MGTYIQDEGNTFCNTKSLRIFPMLYSRVVLLQKEKQSYLETVEICMTRDFGLIDCSGTYQQKNRLTRQENQILSKMSVSLSDIEDCDKSGVFYKPFAQK